MKSSSTQYRWDIFLSYSSNDKVAVQRIQRYLERFKLPDGKRLRVFRDETDIRGGRLPDELESALAASRCLAIFCSESSAKSTWVREEIAVFQGAATERPIVPMVLSGDAERVLPDELPGTEFRYGDLSAGWGLRGPRNETRTELIRLIATASDNEFRLLLPLDTLRRKRIRNRVGALILVLAAGLLSWPVVYWRDITPDGMNIYGCDTSGGAVILFAMNSPQSVKPFFEVMQLDTAGKIADRQQALDPGLELSGRLLSAVVLRPRKCGLSAGWVGRPNGQDCMTVTRSYDLVDFDAPGGGAQAHDTVIRFADEQPVAIGVPWTPIDESRWESLGQRVSPSEGVAVSVAGSDRWLGLRSAEFSRGGLWHYEQSNSDWSPVWGISDVGSVRHLEVGVMFAGRQDGNLGFYLRDGERFAEYTGPGVGNDLEVCGQIDKEPVLRVDQSVFQRSRTAWLLQAL